MLIGYARVSKADGSQSLDLQHDALRAAGVERDNIYDEALLQIVGGDKLI
ncbi:recombinase family protein, partial [Salmonella enterica]|nr:recombinase family protein [Salmonella enterica]